MPPVKGSSRKNGNLSKTARTLIVGAASATAVSLLVGTTLWLIQRSGRAIAPAAPKDRSRKKKKSRNPRGSSRAAVSGSTPVTGSGSAQSAGADADGDEDGFWTAAELVAFAPSSRRRDRLKRSHVKRAVQLLEELLARNSAEEADEVECSLLFRCLVGFGKWRVLFCKPDRKGNSSLLHVVAASHDPRSGRMFGAGQRSDEDDDDEDEDAEPIVAMTCISLHTSGHGARSALASLQLSGSADGATEQKMSGQHIFSRKWLNSTRRADFDGIAIDGAGDLTQSMMMSRNLSMKPPSSSNGGAGSNSGVQLRALVVPHNARYNQRPTNFFAQLNRWSSIIEVEGALRTVNEAAKQAKGWGTAKEGLRGLLEELKKKTDEESKKELAALSLAARVIARYANFAWISTRPAEPPMDARARRRVRPPSIATAGVKEDGNVVVFTAPDCVSRSGLARAKEEFKKTGGGHLTWISGHELLQRISEVGPAARSGVDGIIFNPGSFAVRQEEVEADTAIVPEKQFRSMHTVRWTVGFVKLVLDLAA